MSILDKATKAPATSAAQRVDLKSRMAEIKAAPTTAAPPTAGGSSSPPALAAAHSQGSAELDRLYRLVIEGDLSRLSGEQRILYYMETCKKLGLNALSRPLAYIKLDGKLVLYALKEAAAQLGKIHSVSTEILDLTFNERLSIAQCKIRARMPLPGGLERVRDDVACLPCGSGVKGDAAANLLMKLATKATRRATLGICGLGLLDESELDTIPKEKKEFISFDVAHGGGGGGEQHTAAKEGRRERLPVAKVRSAAERIEADDEKTLEIAALPPTVAEEEGRSADPDAYLCERKEDRSWLVGEMRRRFPRLRKDTGSKLANMFNEASSKAAIMAELDRILDAEKQKPQSELL